MFTFTIDSNAAYVHLYDFHRRLLLLLRIPALLLFHMFLHVLYRFELRVRIVHVIDHPFRRLRYIGARIRLEELVERSPRLHEIL